MASCVKMTKSDVADLQKKEIAKRIYDEKIIIKRLEKEFWHGLKTQADFSEFQKRTKFILKNYGTAIACNRFDVGNSIEFLFADTLRQYIPNDLIREEPNAKRVDIVVNNLQISIKYSSSGNIKIHNSLGENKDKAMITTLLITPNKIYLLSKSILKEYDITLTEYLVDTKDGLQLKRSLLTRLNKIKDFNYGINIDISITECNNMLTSRVFYEAAMKQYDDLHN